MVDWSLQLRSIFFLREKKVLFNDTVCCWVYVVATVRHWNMSMQHWWNDNDRERTKCLAGATKFLYIIYITIWSTQIRHYDKYNNMTQR
jgi:hypothetical protein